MRCAYGACFPSPPPHLFSLTPLPTPHSPPKYRFTKYIPLAHQPPFPPQPIHPSSPHLLPSRDRAKMPNHHTLQVFFWDQTELYFFLDKKEGKNRRPPSFMISQSFLYSFLLVFHSNPPLPLFFFLSFFLHLL